MIKGLSGSHRGCFLFSWDEAVEDVFPIPKDVCDEVCAAGRTTAAHMLDMIMGTALAQRAFVL